MEDNIVVDGLTVKLDRLESLSFNEHRGVYGAWIATSHGCGCCSHEYEQLTNAQVKQVAEALAAKYARIAKHYRKLAERTVA